jgi:hypothetical protein
MGFIVGAIFMDSTSLDCQVFGVLVGGLFARILPDNLTTPENQG